MTSQRSNGSVASESAIDDDLPNFDIRIRKWNNTKDDKKANSSVVSEPSSAWSAGSRIDPTPWEILGGISPSEEADRKNNRMPESWPGEQKNKAHPTPQAKLGNDGASENLRATLERSIKHQLAEYDCLVSSFTSNVPRDSCNVETAKSGTLRSSVLPKIPTYIIKRPDGANIVISSDGPPIVENAKSSQKLSDELQYGRSLWDKKEENREDKKNVGGKTGHGNWSREDVILNKLPGAAKKKTKAVEEHPKNSANSEQKGRGDVNVSIKATSVIERVQQRIKTPDGERKSNASAARATAKSRLSSKAPSSPPSSLKLLVEPGWNEPLPTAPRIASPTPTGYGGFVPSESFTPQGAFVPPPASKNSFELGQDAVSGWQLAHAQSVSGAGGNFERQEALKSKSRASQSRSKKSLSNSKSSEATATVGSFLAAPGEPWMSGALDVLSNPGSSPSTSKIRTKRTSTVSKQKSIAKTTSRKDGKACLEATQEVRPSDSASQRGNPSADAMPIQRKLSSNKPLSVSSSYSSAANERRAEKILASFRHLTPSEAPSEAKPAKSPSNYASQLLHDLPPLPETPSPSRPGSKENDDVTVSLRYHQPTVESESSNNSRRSKGSNRSKATLDHVFLYRETEHSETRTNKLPVIKINMAESAHEADTIQENEWAQDAEEEAAKAWQEKVLRASRMKAIAHPNPTGSAIEWEIKSQSTRRSTPSRRSEKLKRPAIECWHGGHETPLHSDRTSHKPRSRTSRMSDSKCS